MHIYLSPSAESLTQWILNILGTSPVRLFWLYEEIGQAIIWHSKLLRLFQSIIIVCLKPESEIKSKTYSIL